MGVTTLFTPGQVVLPNNVMAGPTREIKHNMVRHQQFVRYY